MTSHSSVAEDITPSTSRGFVIAAVTSETPLAVTGAVTPTRARVLAASDGRAEEAGRGRTAGAPKRAEGDEQVTERTGGESPGTPPDDGTGLVGPTVGPALPERSEGISEPRSTGRTSKMPGGASTASIAKALTREIAGRLIGSQQLLTAALTVKGAAGFDRVREGALRLANVLAKRLHRGGALIALDVGKSGRWHLHAILVAPRGFDPDQIVQWWSRSWPKGQRPSKRRGPQKVGVVGLGAVRTVLRHHLSVRVPSTSPPAMVDRFIVQGIMAGAWSATATSLQVPSIPIVAATRWPVVPKLTIAPPPKYMRREGVCGWCAKALERADDYVLTEQASCIVMAKQADDSVATKPPTGYLVLTKRRRPRKGAKWHDGCRRAAHAALRAREKRLVTKLKPAFATTWRRWFDTLEARGWLRRAAMRVASQFASHEMLGTPVGILESLDWRVTRAMSLTCECGRPLAKRMDARTCGKSACRMRRSRSRSSLAAAAVT